MPYVYFTKSLQKLDVPALIVFCQEAGLDGVDLAVRPDYPVTPENAAVELPKAAKQFKDAGLIIGIVTAPTTFTDSDAAPARSLFEACARAGVPAIKIGYFLYKDKFDAGLTEARNRLAGFAKLAEKTGVRACYHTHSGAYYGNNAAGLRLLLQDVDAHHVGAYFDTGHTAINGGPPRMELDMIKPWLSLVAIKDMRWEKDGDAWRASVVPAGEGIVRWNEAAQGLKEVGFKGTISLHGEYETKDMTERKRQAKAELVWLKKRLG